jgi:hypothetical protein
MQSIESVLCDLEWLRLQRRVSESPARALLRNSATLAVIALLRLVNHLAPSTR